MEKESILMLVIIAFALGGAFGNHFSKNERELRLREERLERFKSKKPEDR